LTEAMDLFSLGCVLGELYMDGEGVFDLPGLLEYRGGLNGCIWCGAVCSEGVKMCVYVFVVQHVQKSFPTNTFIL
jgi:hypothetical protein